MKVLSIDLGATSGRVMIVDYNNSSFKYSEIKRFQNKVIEEKDSLRWDFPHLLQEVIEGIKEALLKYSDISSIGIDTWGVDYGLIDKNGQLVSNPRCYRDPYFFQCEKEFLKKMPYEDIYKITGIQKLDFNTIFQLEGEHSDFSDIDCLLLIPDLIAYFLTGCKRMEVTNVSTTSLIERKTGKISKGLIDLLGLKESLFPPLINPGESYGYLKEEYAPLGFNKKIPVIAVCTHDTASAVLGTNGSGNFTYLSSGTWSLIGREEKKPFINDKSFFSNFTNELGYKDTIRLLKNTMGMFIINELREDYKTKGISIPLSDLKRLMEQSKDIHSYIQVNDPIFQTPGKMISKVESYLTKTKQTLPSSPGEMIKLAYISLALAYKSIISDLDDITGVKSTSLIIVGGGNQSEIMNQYTASSTGLEVVTGSSEATVLGNALVQFIALGEIDSAEEGRKIITNSINKKVYRPQDETEWLQRRIEFNSLIKGKE